MGRGAWLTTVHGVTKSRTRLSARAHTHTHTHTHEARSPGPNPTRLSTPSGNNCSQVSVAAGLMGHKQDFCTQPQNSSQTN